MTHNFFTQKSKENFGKRQNTINIEQYPFTSVNRVR